MCVDLDDGAVCEDGFRPDSPRWEVRQIGHHDRGTCAEIADHRSSMAVSSDMEETSGPDPFRLGLHIRRPFQEESMQTIRGMWVSLVDGMEDDQGEIEVMGEGPGDIEGGRFLEANRRTHPVEHEFRVSCIRALMDLATLSEMAGQWIEPSHVVWWPPWQLEPSSVVIRRRGSAVGG